MFAAENGDYQLFTYLLSCAPPLQEPQQKQSKQPQQQQKSIELRSQIYYLTRVDLVSN